MRTAWRSAWALIPFLAACGGADAPAVEAQAQSPPPTAEADPGRSGDVLGTLEATVDGESGTWYVVSGSLGGQPYASGLWMDMGDERQVLAGGFDTADPPLDTFERDADGMPVSYGDYQGSVLSVVVPEGSVAAPFVVRFPTEDASAASVFYQPVATLDDVTAGTYWLAEGTLEVKAVTVEGGVARMEGTFAGTFRSMAGGEAIEMTGGRFAVERLPSLASLR